jgi:uncharacterized protein
MASNPIGWFEIYVEDITRATRFYETVLDVRLERLDSPVVPMWAFPASPDRYGAGGALVQAPGMPVGGNSVMVYFSCADCAVEATRVGEAGGQVVRPRMSIGAYGFVVLARDTEGNLIGLHSPA